MYFDRGSGLQAIAEINQQTGSSIDPNVDANSIMQQTTQGLMAAVSRLPQLLERKRTIEKHTNLLHNLLKVGPYRNAASEAHCFMMPSPGGCFYCHFKRVYNAVGMTTHSNEGFSLKRSMSTLFISPKPHESGLWSFDPDVSICHGWAQRHNSQACDTYRGAISSAFLSIRFDGSSAR